LSGIVEKSVELARTDYDLKKKTDFRHVLITQNVEDNLPDIECCSMEVEQVVLNLLKNAGQAMKHMDVPPKIDIKIYKEGHQLVLIIADNGPGMPEKIRKRIFEPFFTTKPVGEGTGLGLSVSYGIIVESHGGEMSVESEENVGTTFTIKLPVAIAKENAEDQDASSVA
jgi:polar amino acid transport system substrate-binding protein